MKPQMCMIIASVLLLLLACICHTAAVDETVQMVHNKAGSLQDGASFTGLQAVVQADVNYFRRVWAEIERKVQGWRTESGENAAQDAAATAATLKRRRILWQQLTAATFG